MICVPSRIAVAGREEKGVCICAYKCLPMCVSVGVSAYVCLRAECGGANGVLIAWR